MYQLNWIKCQGDAWCNLLNVNLEHPHFANLAGVYLIWHAGQKPRTVRVGSGVIKDRLRAHRGDAAILRYKDSGLFVTWASVPPTMREGVERFLFENLNPLVGEKFPDVPPVNVNLPW